MWFTNNNGQQTVALNNNHIIIFTRSPQAVPRARTLSLAACTAQEAVGSGEDWREEYNLVAAVAAAYSHTAGEDTAALAGPARHSTAEEGIAAGDIVEEGTVVGDTAEVGNVEGYKAGQGRAAAGEGIAGSGADPAVWSVGRAEQRIRLVL